MSRSLFEAIPRALDANGDGVSGAKLYIYTAGTTTPVTAYSDLGMTTPHASPIVADSAGVFAAVYLPDGDYKFRITDADGAVLQEADNVTQATFGANTARYSLDTVADLVADTRLAYTAAAAKHVVAAGDYVEAGGFRYKVAAPGASDHHLTTAGGVKLYVRPGADGKTAFEAWGGVEGGSANGALLQDMIDALATDGGGNISVSFGRWKVDPFTLKEGVSIWGAGRVPHAEYEAGSYDGTALLVTGLVGANCAQFEENTMGYGLHNLSIFDDGSAAIGAVLEVKGVLEPVLDNVELQTLTTSRGTGLALDVSTFETLYGNFNFVTSFCNYGLDITDDCNANTFKGCKIQGALKPLRLLGTKNPAGNAFLGGAIEGTYNTSMELVYLTAANAQKMVDWQAPDQSYIVKWVDLTRGRRTTFTGVYFELGGAPSTYDDGTNGVHNLASVIHVQSNHEGASFLGCDMNTYVYDEGVDTYINPTTFRKEYSNRDRPSGCFRNTTAQSITGYTLTDVDVSDVLLINDTTTMEYDGTAKALTVYQDGVYRISGQVTFDPIANVGDFCYARIATPGGNFRGPNIPIVNTTAEQGRSVSCIVALSRGDTVKLQCYQGTGVAETLNTSPENTYLTIEKV